MSSGFQFITPDGALCGICFEWFNKADLYQDKNGDYWDICKECQHREYKHG